MSWPGKIGPGLMGMKFSVILFVMCQAYGIHRIAFGSCNKPMKGLWRVVETFNASTLVLLGDNVYADKFPYRLQDQASPQDLEDQYKALNADLDWQSMVKRIGVNNIFATFDDHDYGRNNGDKHYAHRNISQQLFWDFMKVQKESGKRLQSGVYTSSTVTIPSFLGSNDFIYKVILLDARSNKDKKGTSGGDFLGAEQWNWLEREIMDEKPHLILLGSGIQILPTGKMIEETWEELPAARLRLLNLVSRASVHTNVVLLSGDVHCAEIMQAKCKLPSLVDTTFPLWELTSSGLTHTTVEYIVQADGAPDAHGHAGGGFPTIAKRGILPQFLASFYTVRENVIAIDFCVHFIFPCLTGSARSALSC